MPTTGTTFEELVDLLEKTKNPFDLSRQLPAIIAGLGNLRDRVRAIEEYRLADMHRMQEMETLTADEKTQLGSLAKDRDDLQKRLAAVEQRLDADEKKKAEPLPLPLLHADIPTPPPTPSFMEKVGLSSPKPEPLPV